MFIFNNYIKRIFILIIISLIIFFTLNLKKSEARRSNDIFSHHKTYIEAHRGVNREFFENTMEAFKKAIEYQLDSIETDVWLTKDNVLVLLHGNSREGSLFKYYDHPGNVIYLTWAELSTYKTIKDNLTMPRLSDLMEISKNKIFINLEIKDKRIDLVFPHLMKLIQKYNFFNQILLSSPFYEYYNKIQEFNKKHHKKIMFGFVYDMNSMNLFDYSKKGNTLNIYWKDATKEVCDKAHKNRMAIIAWIDIFEEDNNDMYKKLVENGVDVICCNNPKLLKSYLEKYYQK